MPVIFFVDPQAAQGPGHEGHRRDHPELYILPGGNPEQRPLEPQATQTRKADHGRDQEPRLSHLVDPDPWPLIGAFSARRAVRRRGHVVHDNPYGKFSCSARLRVGPGHHVQLVVEHDPRSAQGDHTPVVQLHLRYGMILFIASEVMFFLAWFWAFFDSLAVPVGGRGGRRRHGRPRASRCSTRWASRCSTPDPAVLGHDGHLGAPLADPRRPRGAEAGPVVTILLGLLFTAIQAYEYIHAPFALQRQHLRRDLLHGDRLPRLPRHRRHDLPRPSA